MKYPDFFNTIDSIKLQDPLSDFLGTFKDGLVEFSYLDIVKSAGHSCPTVAGAYLLCLEGLQVLYKDTIPKRGNIYVSFKENSNEGVAGVIASVVTHITGATEITGFKGINNNFNRTELMKFNDNIDTSIKLQRLDTGKSIQVSYDPNSIQGDPNIQILMKKIMQNDATIDEKNEFGELWQKRVADIFLNISKVITIKQ